MNLEFTRDQLVTLLTALHAATHLVDDKETRDLEQTVLAAAAEAGMDDLVTREEGELSLSHLLTHELHEDIKTFEDEVFWSSLAEEMGEKDMRVAYNESELSKMNEDEYRRALETFSRYYDTEFEAHGADHLDLDHPLTLNAP